MREAETMQKYVLTVYQPDGDPPPSVDLEKVMRDVNALQDELKAAGSWVFAGSLHPASTATVVQLRNGDMVTTDGPYVEGKEHVGGFTILEAPDLDAALEWGRRFAAAIAPLPIEVRPLHAEH
jgi:hypothetical protein